MHPRTKKRNLDYFCVMVGFNNGVDVNGESTSRNSTRFCVGTNKNDVHYMVLGQSTVFSKVHNLDVKARNRGESNNSSFQVSTDPIKKLQPIHRIQKRFTQNINEKK